MKYSYSIVVVIFLINFKLLFARNRLNRKSIDGRIVGGKETSISHFPHQVSLQIDLRHICGGAILKTDIILTAAHCVTKNSNPNSYFIRAGSSDQAQGGALIGVKRIVKHESFNKPTAMDNDIAILLLKQSLRFSFNIKPIALITSESTVAFGAIFFVAGWGTANSDVLQIEAFLRYTVVQKIDRDNCAYAYRNIAAITSNMFCAGTAAGGRDSCKGDSGGPLVTFVNGAMQMYGIVSWGLSCAKAEFPGVYTRITQYNSWIVENIKKLRT